MSGSVRKRKSLWESKEEIQLATEVNENTGRHGRESYFSHHGRHDSKWSELGANRPLKTKDESSRSSFELSQGNIGLKDDGISRGVNEIPVSTRAWKGDKSCKTFPGLDDLAQRNQSCSPEKAWSESSRERNMNKNRRRSRSRSRSQSRSRGRSRSRSRSRGRGGSGSHSRSPLYRRKSYGWNDRSEFRLSSQPCRDFAVGKCKRGSQCRFLHQDNFDHMDGDRSERDRGERWRSRQELGVDSKYSNNTGPRDCPQDNVSDGYGNSHDRERDESQRSSSQSTILCRDFLKGRCYRGSSCRYPHHCSSGDNFDRSNRTASFDNYHRHLPRKNTNIPCKFFAVGKCHKVDCRFSHDDPVSGNHGRLSWDDRHDHTSDDKKKSWNGPKGDDTPSGNRGRMSWDDRHDHTLDDKKKSWDDRHDHTLDDKKKTWNGPKWDDANAASDVAKFTGWDDGNAGNENCPVPTIVEKRTDDEWSHDFGDEKKSWNGPKCDETTGVSGITEPSGWGNSVVENLNFVKPTVSERRMDQRSGNSSDNQSRIWNSLVLKEKANERDEYRGSNGADMGITKSAGTSKLFVKEELPMISQRLHSQTPDGTSMHVHEQYATQEPSVQQLGTTVMHPLVSENSYVQDNCSKRGDSITIADDSNALNRSKVAGSDVMHPALMPGQDFSQNGRSLGSLPPSSVGTDQSQHMISVNPLNGHNIDLNVPMQQILSPLDPQNQTQIHHGRSLKMLKMSELEIPQVNTGIPVVAQGTSIPASLTQMFGSGQKLPQLYDVLNPSNSIRSVPSLSNAPTLVLPVTSAGGQPEPVTRSREQYDIGASIEPCKPDNSSEPHKEKSPMPLECLAPPSTGRPDSDKLLRCDITKEECQGCPKLQQQKPIPNSVAEESDAIIAEKFKQEQDYNRSDNLEKDGRVGEGNSGKDEKEMRLFKIALVEFVKEILKPTWKEGQMSREVHKTIVKKVVDKVTSTIQALHIPKTQDKIDQYLISSKLKLTKLVQAYKERFLRG